MNTDKRTPIRRDWIAKTLAGALLGLTLALIASGLFSVMAAELPLPIRGQLMMWMVAPLWLGIWSGVYFFASGLRACLWLGAATLVCGATLLALRAGA